MLGIVELSSNESGPDISTEHRETRSSLEPAQYQAGTKFTSDRPSSKEHPSLTEDPKVRTSMAPPPLGNNRRVLEVSSGEDDVPPRTRRTRLKNDIEPADVVAVARHPVREPMKSLPQPKPGHKKPGPKPWAAKPIMKNDMAAKKEVINEIETFWGKGFIKAFIPKCHRPLVKRGRGIKRSTSRDHETDPKKWLPSVLKAVLMIAKLTTDRTWLRKAMGEVVRYRIKHTGNRKPQLVTTDFDVMDDMLTRGWAVESSFGVRYKHLLMTQPRVTEETDEDIEHILQVGSGDEAYSEDGEDEDLEGDESAEGTEYNSEHKCTSPGLFAAHRQESGCAQATPHHSPKRMQTKQIKQHKSSEYRKPMEQSKSQPYHRGLPMQGYGPNVGYGTPTNSHGRQMQDHMPPLKGGPPQMYGYGYYGPYGGYDSWDGYRPNAPAPNNGSRTPYHPLPSPNIIGNPDQHDRFGRFCHLNSSRDHLEQTPSRFSTELSMPPIDTELPTIKRESETEGCPIVIDDHHGSHNYNGPDSEENGVSDEVLQFELQMVEAEHKMLRLRAQMARSKQAKNRRRNYS